MDFTFDLATPSDDLALRRLLATNPIPGSVTVTYEREPDYFLGSATMGHFWQVPVARVHPNGEIAGVACRAVRLRFVNGQVQPVGYLSQLRVDRRFQGHGLTARGFHYLRELHADGRAVYYLATIIEGNNPARRLLIERPQPHFPHFHEVGRIVTLALVVRPWCALVGHNDAIQRGDQVPLCEIVAFLRKQGASRQFFPAYTEADFWDGSTTRAFHSADFLLAVRRGAIAGVLGLWDQSAYKQTVVQSYSGALRWLRPAADLGGRLIGSQPLPAPGSPIRHVFASFVCIADRALEVFPLLLRQALNLAAERGYAYLLLGLAESDPLLALARRYVHIPYYSRLYVVDWSAKGDSYARLDRRPPYVEIATL